MASLVVVPRITSTSFITLAGLKKWRPTTCSGRPVSAAISLTDRPDVLVASSACGGSAASRRRKTWRLMSITSGTASIARSQSASAASSVAVVTRPRTACASSSLMRPRATRRSPIEATCAIPCSSAAGTASNSTTSTPPAAAVWAISLPMIPAPSTAMRRITTPPSAA